MILNVSRIRRKTNLKVHSYRENVSRCRALSVSNLVLILLVGSIATKYILNDEICVALSPLARLMLIAYGRSGGFLGLHFVYLISHLSDGKFLSQNVGLGSSTQAQHGCRSVGDEGDASPQFSA